MTSLAGQAELTKLAVVLGCGKQDLGFLADIEAEQLRSLRDSVTDYLIAEDRPLFRQAGRLVQSLPTVAAARIAMRVGPMLTAGIAAEAPARKGATIALRLPVAFVADICVHLDPRRAREIIRLIPVERIVDIALELDARGDFVTMSRFVDFISDDAILAVEEAIPDEAKLLRIAFLMESKNRVDHIFRMLPAERIQRLLQRVQDDPELLPDFLSLLVHVSYGFKRQLGDIIAGQAEAQLNAYVRGAHEHQLWPDVLPAVAAMSPLSRDRVVNLPLLREADVQLGLLRSAEDHDQWGIVLPLIGRMSEPNREAVAQMMDRLTAGGLPGAVDAALTGEQWDVLCDLVARMAEHRQDEFAVLVAAIGEVDPRLGTRVTEIARKAGVTSVETGSAEPVERGQ